MKNLILLFFLFSLNIYSQDSLTIKQVHFEKGTCYRNDNNGLFSGKAQSYKHKKHLVFETEFKNGILIKSIEYFNGKKRKIAEEIYYGNYGAKQKKIKYEYSIDYKWIEYYNENSQKVLEEEYENGNLVYKCEYLNNKKNGIAFRINKNGEKSECKFENGKLIK